MIARQSGLTVLVADDDRVIRHTVACYLDDIGCEVIEAANGDEALALFARRRPDLLLVDLQMPVKDGLEVLEEIVETSPETPVLIVSGAGDIGDVVRGLRLGAWDWVTKPITDLGLLDHAIERAMERATLLRESRRYREHLETTIRQRTAELERELVQRREAERSARASLARVTSILDGTVHALMRVVEFKDPHTSGHQQRVSELAVAIARELELDEGTVDTLRVAGLLHDIGKICVPAEILSRPGDLRSAEVDLLRMHSEVGYELLRSVPFEGSVAEVVRQHHERLDGSGYPQGLSGESILTAARVLAVADVVEALSSHRPYRPALGLDAALADVAEHCELYDQRVVHACVELFRSGRFSFPYHRDQSRSKPS